MTKSSEILNDPETSAWAAADPHAVNGSTPSGEFEARNCPWTGRDFHTRIYLMVQDPSMENKWDKKFIKRVANLEIDDAWLQENGYFGEYQTIRFWKGPDSREYRQQPARWSILPPLPPKALPRASAGALGAETPLRGAMEEARQPARSREEDYDAWEDRFLLRMAKMKELFAPANAPRVAESDFGREALEKSFERRIKSLDEREGAIINREIRGISAKHKEPESKDGEWLDILKKRYLPKITKYIDRLIEPGEFGKDLRSEILESQTFREIMADPDKKVSVMETLINTLGDAGITLAKFLEKESGTNA